jgi:hypothetical protein
VSAGSSRAAIAQALAGFGRVPHGRAFVAIQWLEWRSKTLRLGTSSYASLYFVTTGLHIAHVIVGSRSCWRRSFGGPRSIISAPAPAGRRGGRALLALRRMVWCSCFTTYYITPYLGFGR